MICVTLLKPISTIAAVRKRSSSCQPAMQSGCSLFSRSHRLRRQWVPTALSVPANGECHLARRVRSSTT
eukprot:10241747-Alexandrium_andersonii.AAC.1